MASSEKDTSAAPAFASRRQPPDARKDEILGVAAAYFAEVGFDGSTRDIARRAGITQPLLYRYFPNKDSLIEAVYQKFYLHNWDQDWDPILIDRSRTVKDRFSEFYTAYTRTIFDPVWLRLSAFAALRDPRLSLSYNHVVQEMILKPLVRERRFELGRGDVFPVSRRDLTAAWLMHGGLLDHGMRQHVLETDHPPTTQKVIGDALDMYLLLTQVQD